MIVKGSVCPEGALLPLAPLDSMTPLSLSFFPSTLAFPLLLSRGTSLRSTSNPLELRQKLQFSSLDRPWSLQAQGGISSRPLWSFPAALSSKNARALPPMLDWAIPQSKLAWGPLGSLASLWWFCQGRMCRSYCVSPSLVLEALLTY